MNLNAGTDAGMDERCKESGAVADARLRLIQAKQWDFSVINYDRKKYGE